MHNVCESTVSLRKNTLYLVGYKRDPWLTCRCISWRVASMVCRRLSSMIVTCRQQVWLSSRDCHTFFPKVMWDWSSMICVSRSRVNFKVIMSGWSEEYLELVWQGLLVVFRDCKMPSQWKHATGVCLLVNIRSRSDFCCKAMVLSMDACAPNLRMYIFSTSSYLQSESSAFSEQMPQKVGTNLHFRGGFKRVIRVVQLHVVQGHLPPNLEKSFGSWCIPAPILSAIHHMASFFQ